MGLHNFIQALNLLVGWSALCYAFAIQILTAEKLLATCLCNLMCRAASAYRFCVCHGIISTPSWKQVTACSQCCMCLWMLDVRHGVASAGFKLWYYQLSQAKHFWICLALSNWDHSSCLLLGSLLMEWLCFPPAKTHNIREPSCWRWHFCTGY